MSLRDELNRRLTDFDLDVSEDFIDTLLPWLEQKFTEAQAETKRIIICVWCGQTIERTGDIKVDVKASQAHDANCEKNPVRRQAQAEMVERCANRVDAYRGVAQKQTAWTWGEVNNLLVDLREQVRALSPDPHAKQRWELEARLMEERVYGYHDPLTHTLDRKSGEAECSTCQRIADLERQLKVPGEEKA